MTYKFVNFIRDLDRVNRKRKKEKWVNIYTNQDFINISTRSGLRGSVADRDQKGVYLPLDVSNLELGQHLREALSLSRAMDPACSKDLDLYFSDIERHHKWVESVMKRFKYKTKGAVFKPMTHCSVILCNNKITLYSWHQCKLQAWEGIESIEASIIIVPKSCADEELGEAAHTAILQCTSVWS